MPMGVDETRNDDGVGCIDDLRARRRDAGRHRDNSLSLDQHVALREIADLTVEAHDGAALDENAAVGIGALAHQPIDRAGVGALEALRRRCTWQRRGRSDEHGAGLEQFAPRGTGAMPRSPRFSRHQRLLFF
jgi:hypothetical protein